MSQRSAGSEGVETVPAKGALQSGHELSAKDFAQDGERIERRVIRRESAAGHHAVHVGMRLQSLPQVQPENSVAAFYSALAWRSCFIIERSHLVLRWRIPCRCRIGRCQGPG